MSLPYSFTTGKIVHVILGGSHNHRSFCARGIYLFSIPESNTELLGHLINSLV
jgi:hypothetical protein